MPTARVVVLVLAGSVLACSSARAQSIQIVSSTNDLHALAHATWTNTQDLQIMPPGVGSIRHSIGVLAYDNAFEAAFLSQLTAVTNGGIARFPVQAIETNTTPRSRIWLNAAGTLVQTTDIPAGYDWMQVARSAYGQPPPWLSGSELDQWYADRAPDRIRVVAELISTSDVPAYLAMLTNSIGSGWDGTTNIPLLTLYSNDLAFVKIERTTGVVHAWVHAPASVSRIETYGSGNLLIPDGWTMISALNYATDPLYWSYPWADDLAILAAGNPAIDTDSDGLSDARELLLYGTLAEVGDTDGDGLSDGAEINTYGLNAKNADSDGDGMEDGWEVANGLNPLNAADAGQDADGDGIPNGIERIIGTNPQVADPVHDVAPGEVSLKYRSQKVQGEKVGFSPFNSGVWLPTEGCEPDGESAPWPPKKYQTYEKMSISESPDGHYYSESQESVGIEGGEARWALSFNGEVYTAIPQCPSNGQTETTTTFSGDFFRTNCGSRCGLTTEITVTKVCEGNYQTNSPAVYSNDWRDIAGETLRTGGSGCDGAYTFDRRTTTWVWENVITSAYSTTTLTYDGALVR
jgi:hypothetical protein